MFQTAKISDGEWLDEAALNAQAMKEDADDSVKPKAKKVKAVKDSDKTEEIAEISEEKPKARTKKKA